MITEIRSEVGAHLFWRWFATEAVRYRNTLEALTRGEADGSDALEKLNRRIRLYDRSLTADLMRSADGGCELRFSGREASIARLVRTARDIRGWRVGYGRVETAQPRQTQRQDRAIRSAGARRSHRVWA